MQIEKSLAIAVVVKRTWANLHGVRMFLREDRQAEIRGIDESHVLFVKVVDAEDSRGMWIEVERHKRAGESGMEQFNILIPWSEVLAVVTAEEFSSAIRQEARRIGFTGEMEPE
jgi:hypothetical protein